jgi:hypothetical protein
VLIFVDCEARGASPVNGTLTEFGCVAYPSFQTFHGRLFDSVPDPDKPVVPLVGERIHPDATVAAWLTSWLVDVAQSERTVMVSDNPAFDFMWIAGMFDSAGMPNPFGYSARRIGDFYAGVNRKWSDHSSWKRLRKTRHDHNPVNDAMGNAEAYHEIMKLVKSGPGQSGVHAASAVAVIREALGAPSLQDDPASAAVSPRERLENRASTIYWALFDAGLLHESPHAS